MKIKLFILATVWVLLSVFASGCIVIDLNGCSAQSVKGSGNCRLRVADTLRAKITGSGDVLYKGYPEIDQTITGSGSVKDRN